MKYIEQILLRLQSSVVAKTSFKTYNVFWRLPLTDTQEGVCE